MTDLLQPHSPSTWRDRVAALRQALPVPASPFTAVAAALGFAVAVVLAVLLLRAPPPPAELTLPRSAEAPPPSSAPVGPDAGGAGGGSGGLATVHVAGQVANPGVYTVPAGARVADVLTAAGGPLGDADVGQINLAAKVSDGERVTVPKPGEVPPAGPATAPAPGGPAGAGGAPRAPPASVDLNTATAEQLDLLPGVGPATAQAILTWRARNGRFRTVADLLEVPGIGPAKLEALRPLVRVT